MRVKEAFTAYMAGRVNRFALYGTEPFFIERFIDIVKSRTNCLIFHPDNADDALMEISLDTLFDPSRSIVLTEFDRMKPERFAQPIRNWAGTLILTFSDKVDLRSRAMTEILTNIEMVSCEKFREYANEYQLWILSVIREAGYEPEDGVEDIIYKRVGPSLHGLSHELDKLFVLKASDKRIAKKDAEQYVITTAQSSAFDVLDCLLRHDVAGALRMVDSHCRSVETPTKLLEFLGMFFEKLYRMLLLKEQGLSPEDIASIVGLSAFHVKTRYLPRSLALGKKFLAERIDQICTMEIGFRSFKGDKRVLLDRFIFSFTEPVETDLIK